VTPKSLLRLVEGSTSSGCTIHLKQRNIKTMEIEEPQPQQQQRYHRNQVQVHWQEDLSHELWLQIFQFTAPQDLLHSVMYVSKSMRDMLEEEACWKVYSKYLLASAANNHNNVMNDTFQLMDSLNKHQLQRLCLFVAAQTKKTCSNNTNNTMEEEEEEEIQPYPHGLQFGSRLLDFHLAMQFSRGGYSTDPNLLAHQLAELRVGGAAGQQVAPRVIGRGARTCLASSTDNASEHLQNVLPGGQRPIIGNGELPRFMDFHRRLRWWSSRATATQDTSETLLFGVDCPLALLSRVEILPLIDPFTRRQIYSWRETIVKAYRLPLHKLHKTSQNLLGFPCLFGINNGGGSVNGDGRIGGLDDDNDDTDSDDDNDDRVDWNPGAEKAALQAMLQRETPVYESPPISYNTPQESSAHTVTGFIVPRQVLHFPPGVMANAITLTLRGKDSRQFPHSGFYACIEQIQVEGVPLLESHAQRLLLPGFRFSNELLV